METEPLSRYPMASVLRARMTGPSLGNPPRDGWEPATGGSVPGPFKVLAPGQTGHSWPGNRASRRPDDFLKFRQLAAGGGGERTRAKEQDRQSNSRKGESLFR